MDATTIPTIKTKLRFTTLICLPEGERILDYVVGDKEFWVVEGAEGFAYVKPAKEGSETNLTLVTASGNVYSLLLTEVSKSGAAPDLKVFLEPDDERLRLSIGASPRFVAASDVKARERALAAVVEESTRAAERFRADYPSRLRFDYAFDKGKAPFRITAVYHDDRFTYIQCDATEKPALYEEQDGQPVLLGFDLKDGVYVVPRILDRGYLVLGKSRFSFARRK